MRTGGDRSVAPDVPALRGTERARRAGPEVLAVVVLTAIGAAARVDGLTRLGLWRDDAWVGLSAAVGPRTAVRMSATTPGFTLAERAWLQLAEPTTSWWGQLPPLALGILAVPAVFLLLRAHGLTPRPALAGAALVMASPVAVTYATRLKPYGFDLLGAVAILWLGERVRQRAERRDLAALAATSILLLATSASTAAVIAGTWAALLVGRRPSRPTGGRTWAWGTAAGAGCAAVYVAFFRGLPPGLASAWHDFYLDLSSIDATRRTSGLAAGRLAEGLVPLPFLEHRPAAVLLLVAVVGLGLTAGRRAWAATLTVLAALAAAALGLAPIGTGRTDEVLYPALILLAGLGLQTAWGAVAPRFVAIAAPGPRARAALATATLLVASAPLLVSTVRREVAYPGTDLARLVDTIDAERIPGDIVVVEPRTRYLWGLTEQATPDVRFGDQWLNGFTVGSTDPGVFVQPSYSVEPGYTPTRWADQLAGATQLLYVSTPFELDPPRPDRAFQALLADGWRPTDSFDVTGGRLVVLRRPLR